MAKLGTEAEVWNGGVKRDVRVSTQQGWSHEHLSVQLRLLAAQANAEQKADLISGRAKIKTELTMKQQDLSGHNI